MTDIQKLCTSVTAVLSQVLGACNFPLTYCSTVLNLFIILDKVAFDSLVQLQDTLNDYFCDGCTLLVQPKILRKQIKYA